MKVKFKRGDRVTLIDYENRDMFNEAEIKPGDIGTVMDVGTNDNEWGLTEVHWDSGIEVYSDEDYLMTAYEEDFLSFREKIEDRLG